MTQMNQNQLEARGIFLDLDGTILDSTEAYVEAANIAFEAVRLKKPQRAVALEIPRRLEQGLPISDLTDGKAKDMLHFYFEAFHSVAEAKTRLLPNVPDALATLSQQSKLALVTMRHVPSAVIEKELDNLDIARYFSHIVSALDTAKPKPSPEALIRCVEALDVDMCDCIIAGDSVSDVRAGKAAGARTVGLLSGLFCREELAKECPDLILPDVTALPKFVR